MNTMYFNHVHPFPCSPESSISTSILPNSPSFISSSFNHLSSQFLLSTYSLVCEVIHWNLVYNEYTLGKLFSLPRSHGLSVYSQLGLESSETLPHDWKLTVLILCLSYEVNHRCWEFMCAVVGHSWKVLFLWNLLRHLPLTIFPFPFPWHHLNPAVKGMIQMSNLRLGLTESLILCIGLSVTTTLTAQKNFSDEF